MSNITNIMNHLLTIISNDIKLLNSYNYNSLNTLTDIQIENIISNLTNHISWYSPNYKYENYWELFNFIVNIILNTNTPDELNLDFLCKLSILNNGQILLEKIKDKIIKNINDKHLSKFYINKNILYLVCLKGTFPIFMFWKRFIDDTDINQNYEYFLCNSCMNNDNRIFQFLLNKQKILDKYELLNNKIDDIFLHLFDYRIANKKKLKMIKELNNHIKLDNYFEKMIDHFSYSIKSFEILSKYYYKTELSFKFLYTLLKTAFRNTQVGLQTFQYVHSILKFPNEKYYYFIIKNLFFNNISKSEIEMIYDHDFLNIIIKNNKIIINELINFDISEISSNKLVNYIIKYYCDNLYLSKYIKENIGHFYSRLTDIWYYTRFYMYEKYEVIVNTPHYKRLISYNFILHRLRCIAKKKKNLRNKEKRLTMLPILNEITNFTPNKKYSVLINGSINYQKNKKKFTKLSPRHILPHEINYLENCLIKEKSDGINVTQLPNNIYPLTKIIENDIKAEYIEELDLYLVYDINLPDMDIIERQTFLRNEHLYTNKLNNCYNINNFDELLCCIEQERNNIKQFLKNSNDIKWYPKASFKIDKFDHKFSLAMNNYIEELDNNINLYINTEGIIKNDGFIITPLDGNQEIKLKPKSLLTIDLLFKNNSWIDSNNIKHLNITSNSKPKENKIYRCYPILKRNMFEAKEIRYDKKQPNTNKICNLLKTLVNFNWLKICDENNNYYQKNEIFKNPYIIKILQDNKNIFIDYIKSINPEQNKNWLDLGCGKCKFINDLKIYNPKKYLGIDIDIKNTIKTHNKYNEYSIFQIYNCNLEKDWEDTAYKIITLDYNIKYDYIFCNFSLMHFSTNAFWSQLDKITKSGSIFIFNITLENSLWIYNNSYLKSNNYETELYLEWMHTSPIKEKIISSAEIINTIKKYNWRLINKIQYTNNNLIKCYDWYTIVKN